MEPVQRYWALESELRMLTEGMTAREKEDLHDLGTNIVQRSAMKYFGLHQSLEVMEHWAVELLSLTSLPRGVPVSPKEELWTVCKGIMRAYQESQGHRNFAACQCLAKTYFMPQGCGCKPPLTAAEREQHQVDFRMCDKCSVCLRCNKLLVSIDLSLITYHVCIKYVGWQHEENVATHSFASLFIVLVCFYAASQVLQGLEERT